MKLKSILFIAYFYPPAQGLGLPAVQRTHRFIKYLDIPSIHVLTIDPQCYPEFVSKNYAPRLSTTREVVHRTRTIDLFKALLRWREALTASPKKMTRPAQENSGDPAAPAQSDQNLSQGIKDFVSGILKYPDFAAPWLLPAVVEGRRLIQRNRIDVIFATGMPWTSLVVGFLLKRLTKAKLVVDFRDPWVDNPYIPKGRVEAWMDRKFESAIVKEADLVIANTDFLREEMAVRYPGFKEKSVVIPNGYDPSDFDDLEPAPKPPSPLRGGGMGEGLSDKPSSSPTISSDELLISHAGLLYPNRDPACILNAIEEIRSTHPVEAEHIKFQQIGDVNLAYDIHERCREKKITANISVLPNMEHKKCLQQLAQSDVLLLIQPGTKTQIPSKIYEYIYLEKPIIAITEREGALGELINRYGFGVVFEPHEPSELASYLLDLKNQKARNGTLWTSYTNKMLFDAQQVIRQLQQILCVGRFSDRILLQKGQ